jgi:hypothetical protein
MDSRLYVLIESSHLPLGEGKVISFHFGWDNALVALEKAKASWPSDLVPSPFYNVVEVCSPPPEENRCPTCGHLMSESHDL